MSKGLANMGAALAEMRERGTSPTKWEVNSFGKQPCPFCSNEDIRLVEDNEIHWVECYKCGAEGPIRLERRYALMMWNKRMGAV